MKLSSYLNSSDEFSRSLFEFFSRTVIMQSPRKKRDFYGKSSGTPVSHNRSSRHMNKEDSSTKRKTRPSSTPACMEVVQLTVLPDRPVSNPPLRSSTYG